ncbi:MAG: polysaccharide biosynthesis tyrosine autokinase [Burkholderiaceae bacterium]
MDHSLKQTELAASIVSGRPTTPEDLRLGSLLVKHGIITANQVTTILARAHKDHVPFGEAALRSGLVGDHELNRIIAIQFRHKLVNPEKSRIGSEVITAFSTDDRVANEIRALRSQLMLQWLAGESSHNRTLAIVSPERSIGRSFLAANLATAFAQSGHRTLLIDGDLRNPRQHKLFGLANETGFSSVLSGRAKDSFVYRLSDLPGLSIMSAGGIPPNPAELLLPDLLSSLFERCSHKYQVTIVDTPSADSGPDAELIASQASGYIMLGRAGTTQYEPMKQLSARLTDLGAKLIGSVMSAE